MEAYAVLEADTGLAFKLACWVRGQQKLGRPPLINVQTVEWIKTFPIPSLSKRIELYLGTVIELLSGSLMGRFNPALPKLRVASWSSDPTDCEAIARELTIQGAFETKGGWLEQTHSLLESVRKLSY